jgi:hypothetical protein
MNETAQKIGLTDFFLRLGEDPARLTAFERDPERELLAAGLAEDQIAAVLHGGHQDVRLALEAELTRDPVWRHVLTPTRMTKPTWAPPKPDGDDDDEGDKKAKPARSGA